MMPDAGGLERSRVHMSELARSVISPSFLDCAPQISVIDVQWSRINEGVVDVEATKYPFSSAVPLDETFFETGKNVHLGWCQITTALFSPAFGNRGHRPRAGGHLRLHVTVQTAYRRQAGQSVAVLHEQLVQCDRPRFRAECQLHPRLTNHLPRDRSCFEYQQQSDGGNHSARRLRQSGISAGSSVDEQR